MTIIVTTMTTTTTTMTTKTRMTMATAMTTTTRTTTMTKMTAGNLVGAAVGEQGGCAGSRGGGSVHAQIKEQQ
jgi:hypothetical protein